MERDGRSPAYLACHLTPRTVLGSRYLTHWTAHGHLVPAWLRPDVEGRGRAAVAAVASRFRKGRARSSVGADEAVKAEKDRGRVGDVLPPGLLKRRPARPRRSVRPSSGCSDPPVEGVQAQRLAERVGRMRITVTGGTGFLGRALVTHLLAEGHDVTVLSRKVRQRPDPVGGDALRPHVLAWPARNGDVPPDAPWQRALLGADALVHLAGEPIGQGRWTSARKAEIQDSRIRSTAAIVETLRDAPSSAHRPGVIVSASAVGYYGPCGDEEVPETHPAGDDFLARVCRAWEGEIRGAETTGVRVVRLRTGVVLDATQGALPQFLRPIRMGIGGPLGSGRQWVPWIHPEDWVRLAAQALTQEAWTGAVNACAPYPVRQEDLMRVLGQRLGRPIWLRTPAWALRLALGEMADGLVLAGQRAVPAAAQAVGFPFSYPDLLAALDALPLSS